jgi:uncharacterized membrane protein
MPNHISKSTGMRHDTERWTSRVLRIGVWVSASFMIAGLLISAIYPSTIVAFSSNPTFGNLVTRMLSGSFDPITLMFAGLIFLMFTPILRVITAVVGFGVERDWRFVFVSSVVLLLLVGEIIYSIFIKG